MIGTRGIFSYICRLRWPGDALKGDTGSGSAILGVPGFDSIDL